MGKILHSPEYPLKSPDFMMLTPNGRFMDNKKICLSNSSYHSNEWSAMWTVKSILIGFLSIMLDDNENGISHIHDSKESRKNMAANSIAYNKKYHMDIIKRFTRLLLTKMGILLLHHKKRQFNPMFKYHQYNPLYKYYHLNNQLNKYHNPLNKYKHKYYQK